MRSAVVLLGLISGCWRDAVPKPEQTDPVPVAPSPPPPRASHHSEWQGHYLCPQGQTGVRLSLDVTRSGDATAVFDFSALQTNPGVPHGSYRMRGNMRMVAGGAFELKLAPDQWIEQPAGYIMIGLTAVSDRERRALTGRIDDPRCGEIAISRIN